MLLLEVTGTAVEVVTIDAFVVVGNAVVVTVVEDAVVVVVLKVEAAPLVVVLAVVLLGVVLVIVVDLTSISSILIAVVVVDAFVELDAVVSKLTAVAEGVVVGNVVVD